MADPEEVGHGSPLGNKFNCISIESLHLHEIYSADKNLAAIYCKISGLIIIMD